jgi:hypothetical protein
MTDPVVNRINDELIANRINDDVEKVKIDKIKNDLDKIKNDLDKIKKKLLCEIELFIYDNVYITVLESLNKKIYDISYKERIEEIDINKINSYLMDRIKSNQKLIDENYAEYIKTPRDVDINIIKIGTTHTIDEKYKCKYYALAYDTSIFYDNNITKLQEDIEKIDKDVIDDNAQKTIQNHKLKLQLIGIFKKIVDNKHAFTAYVDGEYGLPIEQQFKGRINTLNNTLTEDLTKFSDKKQYSEGSEVEQFITPVFTSIQKVNTELSSLIALLNEKLPDYRIYKGPKTANGGKPRSKRSRKNKKSKNTRRKSIRRRRR